MPVALFVPMHPQGAFLRAALRERKNQTGAGSGNLPPEILSAIEGPGRNHLLDDPQPDIQEASLRSIRAQLTPCLVNIDFLSVFHRVHSLRPRKPTLTLIKAILFTANL